MDDFKDSSKFKMKMQNLWHSFYVATNNVMEEQTCPCFEETFQINIFEP
jgi:hypothetical protein